LSFLGLLIDPFTLQQSFQTGSKSHSIFEESKKKFKTRFKKLKIIINLSIVIKNKKINILEKHKKLFFQTSARRVFQSTKY